MSNIKTRSFKLTTLVLLFPLFFYGQTLTGLWVGTLHNDSATIRKDQSFEIALTEYKGKVYGYSRSEFIVNDTLYYIMKRVKGTIEGDVCEVTDDEIISYNFRGRLDKGVKVTSTFRRNNSDSTWYLDGTWKTNVTKKYYAVTGKVGLEEEKDLANSKIFPHLEELNLANDVAFYKDFKEQKEQPVIAKIARPEKIRSEYNDRKISPDESPALNPLRPDLQRSDVDSSTIVEVTYSQIPSIKKTDDALSKTNVSDIPSNNIALKPSVVTKSQTNAKAPAPVVVENKTTTSVTNKPIVEKTNAVSQPVAKTTVDPNSQKASKSQTNISAPTKNPVTTTVALNTNTPVDTKKPASNPVATNMPVNEKKIDKPEPFQALQISRIEMTDAEIIASYPVIAGRKSEFSQVVRFKSDSLELALYDNGEVDGDTVSVYLNGEVLMSRQGLKSSAIKKTIYITSGNEDFGLVLFAENLGKYPPNTGLLVVHDGDDVYNLRFSSDFQKSAGIIFKKQR